MKIISKFRDYYDTAIQAGMTDETLVFKRFTKVEEVRNSPELNRRQFKIDPKEIEELRQLNESVYVPSYLILETGLLYFCGKVYPFVRTNYDKQRFVKDCYYYSIDDLFEQYPFLRGPIKNHSRVFYSTDQLLYEHFKQEPYPGRWFVQDYREANKKFLKYLLEERCPYAVKDYAQGIVYYPRIVYYPKLADYEFFKVFDLYSCLQILEQYLTNELQPPDLVDVNISDDLKAHSHGFNKWSFRKEPTKNKNKN